MRKYAPLFALSPRTLNCHPERPQGVEGSTPLRKSETERSLDALRLLGMTCESTCRTLHCRPVLCIVILSARSAVEGSVPFSVSKESGSFDCAFGALRMTRGRTGRGRSKFGTNHFPLSTFHFQLSTSLTPTGAQKPWGSAISPAVMAAFRVVPPFSSGYRVPSGPMPRRSRPGSYPPRGKA